MSAQESEGSRTLLGVSVSVAALALAAFLTPHADAQQITGTPGATTTIDGTQLPPPDPKFGARLIDSDQANTTGENA